MPSTSFRFWSGGDKRGAVLDSCIATPAHSHVSHSSITRPTQGRFLAHSLPSRSYIYPVSLLSSIALRNWSSQCLPSQTLSLRFPSGCPQTRHPRIYHLSTTIRATAAARSTRSNGVTTMKWPLTAIAPAIRRVLDALCGLSARWSSPRRLYFSSPAWAAWKVFLAGMD